MALTKGLLSPLLDMGTLFPSTNWWNLDVTEATIDPADAAIKLAIIADAGGITGAKCHPDFGGDVGIPYCVVDNTVPRVVFTPGGGDDTTPTFDYDDESDYEIGGLVGYPIPVEARTDEDYMENGEYNRDPDNTGDAHLLMVDISNNILYELSYAAPVAALKWHAGAGCMWNLGANARRPDGWTSTDAAGLAVLPGLLRYDEVVLSTGPIKHAFRTAVKKSNGYVWPASHSREENAGSPPMGLRLRLKSDFNIDTYLAGSFSGYGPLTTVQKVAFKKVFVALKTYGLIVADGGGAMHVMGTRDTRWNTFITQVLMNKVFQGINVNNFDILTLGWPGPPGYPVIGRKKVFVE